MFPIPHHFFFAVRCCGMSLSLPKNVDPMVLKMLGPACFAGFDLHASVPFMSATMTATLSEVYRLTAMSTSASATSCALLPLLNWFLQSQKGAPQHKG